MIGFIIGLLIIGLIAGFLARLLVPGPDPMGVLGTLVLGIIGSIIGAIVVLLIYRFATRRRGRVGRASHHV